MSSIHTKLDKDLDKSTFGFWIYIMTDCVLFATLFATYAVLRNNTAGGPSGAELFSLPFVLIETLLLLSSSFTAGLAMLAIRAKNMTASLWLLAATAGLGLTFLGMELYEFSHLIADGHSWTVSAFLTAFFTLVATHGLHITIGLLWLGVITVQLVTKGFTHSTVKRFTLFSLFWHFLDIVWIFIFTIVYLLGAVS